MKGGGGQDSLAAPSLTPVLLPHSWVLPNGTMIAISLKSLKIASLHVPTTKAYNTGKVSGSGSVASRSWEPVSSI